MEAELAELLAGYADRRLSDGRSAVVRNGYQPEREIVTGIGSVPVRIPWIRSRDGAPVTFRFGSGASLRLPESFAGRRDPLAVSEGRRGGRNERRACGAGRPRRQGLVAERGEPAEAGVGVGNARKVSHLGRVECTRVFSRRSPLSQ